MDPVTLGLSIIDKSLDITLLVMRSTPEEVRAEQIKTSWEDWKAFRKVILDLVELVKKNQ